MNYDNWKLDNPELDSEEVERIDITDVTDLEVDGVDSADYPDFSDAFFCSGWYKGRELTDEELSVLGENYPEVLGEYAYESLI